MKRREYSDLGEQYELVMHQYRLLQAEQELKAEQSARLKKNTVS